MISTVDEFERRLNVLDPEADDFAFRADDLVADLSPDIAAMVYEPIFRFFESYPRSYYGAPGTLVHHVEHFYPNYVAALRESIFRTPSFSGLLMINRIMNSNITKEERAGCLAVLRSVIDNGTVPSETRNTARRFFDRQRTRVSL